MNIALRHPLGLWRWRHAQKRFGGDWPAPALQVAEAPLLAIDLEMTGLDPARDEIVSVGWVPIDAGAIDLAGARVFRLSRRHRSSVGDSATIHGLRDCDLEGARAPAGVLDLLVEALRGRVAVFHHAPLDLSFLKIALAEHGAGEWRTPVIDTLAWHRRRLPHTGAQVPATLAAACRHWGLAPHPQHDALADALACAELLLVLARHGRARLIEIAQPPSASRSR